ncbi:hypothetical protein CGLO_14590 [Colletotrichum gloeosporioides Cg-14]|jgi:hypothetical protein
MTLG